MTDTLPQNETEQTKGQENDSSKEKNNQKIQATVIGLVRQLEEIFDEYMVKKAFFTFPPELKELLVTVAPYIIIIFTILNIPLFLEALGLSAMLMPLGIVASGWGISFGLKSIVVFIVTGVTVVMELFALPGLFMRKSSAWRLLFYASILSFFGNILSFQSLVGGIIGALLSWYILFQVKDMYKDEK